jgi:hypothetical protein
MRVLLAFDREYPLYIEAIAEAIRTFRSNVEVALTEAGNLEAEVERLAPQLVISTSHIPSNPVDPKLISSLELSLEPENLEPEQTSKFRAGEHHWESTHLTLAQILSLVDETTWLYRTSPEQVPTHAADQEEESS